MHAIDCSAGAIAQALAASGAEFASGRLSDEQVAIEDVVLGEGELPFDLAFAVRVRAWTGATPPQATEHGSRWPAHGRLFVDIAGSMTEVSPRPDRAASAPAQGRRDAELMTPDEVADEVSAAVAAVARPVLAPAMAAYMRDVAPFFGVPAPARRAATRPLVRGLDLPAERPELHLLAVAAALWQRPEREHQYVAADLLRTHARHLGPSTAEPLGALITARAWWDTVDALASAVRAAADRRSGWVEVFDRWAGAEDRWLRRVALLSQLGKGGAADVPRLFASIDRNAADPDFFVRKAIGWALRDLARHHPDAVREFVDQRQGVLSPLSRREALKHLGVREDGPVHDRGTGGA